MCVCECVSGVSEWVCGSVCVCVCVGVWCMRECMCVCVSAW